VALYGHPGTAALGVLGEQDLPGSIARVQKLAASYAALSDVPVVPTFEIIATTASSEPGADRDYSSESTVESLRPWVDRAAAAGMYVVIDLQPGRADSLSQARRYIDLLRLPNVGLALDPESFGSRLEAAGPDWWRRRRRHQRRHRLARRAHRHDAPAAEAPRAAPVPALDDPPRTHLDLSHPQI